MKNKIIASSLVLALAVSYIGIATAHGFNSNENIDSASNEYYKEMLELHKQYYNGDITAEEFFEKMENNEFHEKFEENMPCHGGYKTTGFSTMGMMV